MLLCPFTRNLPALIDRPWEDARFAGGERMSQQVTLPTKDLLQPPGEAYVLAERVRRLS